MSLFDKEEVVAPTQVAAVAAAVAPKPYASKVECTRDTRGDAPCVIKDCENCN
jgi:hypothetical protein